MVGTETVNYAWSGNVLTATIDDGGPRDGTDLFTVGSPIQATGAYKVTLLDNVLHAMAVRTTRTIRSRTVRLAYTITDADGSPANGTLTITFDDDAPTATNEASQNVAEGATTCLASSTSRQAPTVQRSRISMATR